MPVHGQFSNPSRGIPAPVSLSSEKDRALRRSPRIGRTPSAGPGYRCHPWRPPTIFNPSGGRDRQIEGEPIPPEADHARGAVICLARRECTRPTPCVRCGGDWKRKHGRDAVTPRNRKGEAQGTQTATYTGAPVSDPTDTRTTQRARPNPLIALCRVLRNCICHSTKRFCP
jgi:hypothetical protein